MRSGNVILTTLAAALTLSLAVGIATASRGIEIEPTILHTATSSEFVFTEEGGGSIRCAATLVASLHRSIAKARGTLAGFVTEGRAERCRSSVGTNGLYTFLVERGGAAIEPPWHIAYESFSGTLPNITNILFIIFRFRFLASVRGLFGERLNECLYQGNIGVDARGRAANEVERIVIQANQTVTLLTVREERGRPCARRGTLTGTFTLRTRIGLRLI